MSSEYRMQLRRHVADVQSRFGSYVRTPFETGILDDASLSDKAAYFLTKLWRDNVDMAYRMSQQPGAGYAGAQQDSWNAYGDHKRRHLVMYKSGGSYMMVDRTSGDVEAIINPSRDRLEFIGSEYAINLMGGRERFGRIVQIAEELDEDPHLLHDRYRKAA
jgi:hypothetical protein